ncbi:MAG: hypothetical protein ABIH92_02470, partial [Nanoarchaeota archaeon]
NKAVHRVVHGGKFNSPKRISSSLISELKKYGEFAPLHQDIALEIIEHLGKRFNGVVQYACFDTSFHLSMPKVSRTYAIPKSLSERFKIERYGFHGLAHESMYNELCKLKKVRKVDRVISCQLGSGVSLCAIKDGKSIETTMGFTPLEGVVMGTRSGSIDVAIVPFLSRKLRKSSDEVVNVFEKKSGLLGLCGASDMRIILERTKRGDKRARFALDVFVHSFKKHLGQMVAVLGGVDAVVLGGGISNSDVMRKRLFEGLGGFGIKIGKRKIGKETPVKISSGGIEVWALDGDEMKEMFELVKRE